MITIINGFDVVIFFLFFSQLVHAGCGMSALSVRAAPEAAVRCSLTDLPGDLVAHIAKSMTDHDATSLLLSARSFYRNEYLRDVAESLKKRVIFIEARLPDDELSLMVREGLDSGKTIIVLKCGRHGILQLDLGIQERTFSIVRDSGKCALKRVVIKGSCCITLRGLCFLEGLSVTGMSIKAAQCIFESTTYPPVFIRDSPTINLVRCCVSTAMHHHYPGILVCNDARHRAAIILSQCKVSAHSTAVSIYRSNITIENSCLTSMVSAIRLFDSLLTCSEPICYMNH